MGRSLAYARTVAGPVHVREFVPRRALGDRPVRPGVAIRPPAPRVRRQRRRANDIREVPAVGRSLPKATPGRRSSPQQQPHSSGYSIGERPGTSPSSGSHHHSFSSLLHADGVARGERRILGLTDLHPPPDHLSHHTRRSFTDTQSTTRHCLRVHPPIRVRRRDR